MVIGGIVLFKHEIVTRANIYGKIAAVLFYLALAFTFFHVYLSKLYLYMMYLAMAFSLVAFIQYFYVNIYRTFCNPKKENDKPDMLNKKLN